MAIQCSYQFKNKPAELDRLCRHLDVFGQEKNIPPKCQFEIHLAVEEHFTNIISHGYADQDEHLITVRLECENKVVKITMEDDGIPFDPLSINPPDIHLPLEERKIGGLGVHLTRQCVDDIAYQRIDNKNILILTKHIS